jgi:hypothetical protein
MHGVLLTDTPAVPTSTGQWAVIVGGILFLIYVTCIRPMRGKARRDPLARAPGQAMLSHQRAVERDMTALLVEYEQMIRRMTAQVETRITKLELLMADADRTLADLRAATAARATAAPATTSSPAGGSPVADPHISAAERHDLSIRAVDASQEVTARSFRGIDRAAATIADAVAGDKAAGVSGAGRSDRAPFRPVARVADPDDAHEGPPPPPASPHAELYALSDNGMTAGQIARHLSRPYGEVDLILALRPGKPAKQMGKGPATVAVEPAVSRPTPADGTLATSLPAGTAESPKRTIAEDPDRHPRGDFGSGSPEPAAPSMNLATGSPVRIAANDRAIPQQDDEGGDRVDGEVQSMPASQHRPPHHKHRKRPR